MLDSLFAADSEARRVAEFILGRAGRGRWATDRQIRERAGPVSKQQIGKVRDRLRAAGLLGLKGEYSRWRDGRPIRGVDA